MNETIKEVKVPENKVNAVATKLPNTTNVVASKDSTQPTSQPTTIARTSETVTPEEQQNEQSQDLAIVGSMPVIQFEKPEFGNMKDEAVVHYIRMNPNVDQATEINGYTVQQWLYAKSFGFTPEQFKKKMGFDPVVSE